MWRFVVALPMAIVVTLLFLGFLSQLVNFSDNEIDDSKLNSFSVSVLEASNVRTKAVESTDLNQTSELNESLASNSATNNNANAQPQEQNPTEHSIEQVELNLAEQINTKVTDQRIENQSALAVTPALTLTKPALTRPKTPLSTAKPQTKKPHSAKTKSVETKSAKTNTANRSSSSKASSSLTQNQRSSESKPTPAANVANNKASEQSGGPENSLNQKPQGNQSDSLHQQTGGSIGISKAIALKRAEPIYPRSAKRRKLEGFVELSFKISNSGVTKDISIIIAQPSKVFDEAAIKAVKTWRYEVLKGQKFYHPQKVRLEFKLR